MYRVFTSYDDHQGYPQKNTVDYFNTSDEAQAFASGNDICFVEYLSWVRREQSEALRAMSVSAYFS